MAEAAADVRTFDHIIIGVGIMGLALAREIKRRDPGSRILVFDKEARPGMHGSGRNSGVLHSGIYYPEGSLKARVCAEGARRMTAYCEENRLPLSRRGKVIVPTREQDDPQIELLYRRAEANGARCEVLDAQQLRQIEPDVHSASGRAMHVPDTAVIDSLAILRCLVDDLSRQNVVFLYSAVIDSVDSELSSIVINGQKYSYGHIYNTSGLQADRVARLFGAGRNYTILPFKGIYHGLASESGVRCNGLIYPVPDLNVPFLGVHFTKNTDGTVYIGPTALPAWSRENYRGLQGFKLSEAITITWRLFLLYLINNQGFRAYSHREALRSLTSQFVAAAQALVPKTRAAHLLPKVKVGIRAQLLDLDKKELVMDFLVERHANSFHVLNAVSPAFTSAFSFAELIMDTPEG